MTYNFDGLSKSMNRIMSDSYNSSTLRKECKLYDIYPNAYVARVTKVHGGVYESEDYRPVPITSISGYNPPAFPLSLSKSCLCSNNKVIFIGSLNNCWGNVISDLFSHLWFVITPECKKLRQEGWTFVCISQYSRQEEPRYLREILKAVGIDEKELYWVDGDNPTNFAEVLVPEACFRNEDGESWFTKRYPLFCQEFVKLFPKVQPIEKVYFTRTKFLSGSSGMGEAHLEHLFRKQGYTIISPETYSVAEQVSLLSQCTYFAATEGSISHNAVFCRPGTHVIVLKKADYLNGYQRIIDESAELDVTYLTAHHSSKINREFPWYGPFYLCITPQLAKYFGIRFYCPYWLMPSYWWYCLEYTPSWFQRQIMNRQVIKKIRGWIIKTC